MAQDDNDQRQETSAAWIARRYDLLANVYDTLAAPYEWVGGRRLVQRAVAELHLSPSDTAVALGTGTGWSLPLLAEAVGPTGSVLGVDLSARMLQRARRRVDDRGVGDRVQLVVGDMRTIELPTGCRGVLAAFSAEMVDDHDALIDHLAGQLEPGARIALCGLREPESWPDWLVRTAVFVNRPFGTREFHRGQTPWRPLLDRLDDPLYDEDFGGAVYLAVGSVS